MKSVKVTVTYDCFSDDVKECKRLALHHLHSELEKWKRGEDFASRMWDLEVIE